MAGRATIDGGVMVDLSPMKGIHVDPRDRSVHAQGGVTWAELNRETQLHGLAVTGGVLAQWTQPQETSRCVAWARETYERMQPFFASGRYVNYLGDDEASESVAAAYGPNYRRLQRIKAKLDPKNFFRMNQNIRPRA